MTRARSPDSPIQQQLNIATAALEKIGRLRTDLRGDFSMGSHQSDIARTALDLIKYLESDGST